jgi:hypothetical protein
MKKEELELYKEKIKDGNALLTFLNDTIRTANDFCDIEKDIPKIVIIVEFDNANSADEDSIDKDCIVRINNYMEENPIINTIVYDAFCTMITTIRNKANEAFENL